MINSEKKFPFLRKNDPQHAIVVLGLWICVATVALIFVLNFSARKKSAGPRVEVKLKKETVHQGNPNYLRYGHAGYAMKLAGSSME